MKLVAWGIALALLGCDDATAPESRTEQQQNTAFTTPLAFTMPGPSGCGAGYRPAEGVCVHEAAERVMGPDVTKAALDAYRRGASSPRFDIGEGSSRIEHDTPTVEQVKAQTPDKWDPGGLQSDVKRDPKQVESNRLNELQRQINKERVRVGLAPTELKVPEATPASAIEGARVEVEIDGVKRTMSASEWVEQQRVQEREAQRKKAGK